MKAKIKYVFIFTLLFNLVNSYSLTKSDQQRPIEDIIDLQLNVQTSLDKRSQKVLPSVLQQKSIKDIQVKQETMENMNMEDVLKIANRMGSNNSSDSDPMDRVVMFLQQEQKMVEKENEKKREKAISEIIKQDNQDQQQKKEIQSILQNNDQNQQIGFQSSKNQEQLILTDDTLQNDKLSQSPNLIMKPVSQVRKTKVDENDLQKIKQELLNNISQQKQLKQKQIENVNKPQQLPKSLTQILQNKTATPVVVETAAPVVDTFELKRKMIDEKKQLEEKMKVMMAQKEKATIPVESVNDEDNMSIAEIIAKKYKKHIHQSSFKTPEDAAKVMIKDTKEYNVNSPDITLGSKDEQELYQSELGNIETNLAEKWSDLGSVKQVLWKKLNGDKEMQKEKQKKQVRLAQLTERIHQQVLAQKVKKQSIEQPLKLTQNDLNEAKFESFTKFDVKLFEEDTTLIVVLVILAIIVLLCCACYWTTCCCICSARNKAKREQERAKNEMEKEQSKENEEKAEKNES